MPALKLTWVLLIFSKVKNFKNVNGLHFVLSNARKSLQTETIASEIIVNNYP